MFVEQRPLQEFDFRYLKMRSSDIQGVFLYLYGRNSSPSIVIGPPVSASWRRRQLVGSEKNHDRQHCRRSTGRAVQHDAWKRCCT